MKESLLWQLVHPSTNVTHYIYGTMHVKNEAAYTYIKSIETYIKKCDLYVGEMDLNDPVLAHLHDYFSLSNGMNLTNLIGMKKYAKYKRIILKAFNLNIDHYMNLKPMIISNMIAEKLLTSTYELSLDQYLWEYATNSDKIMCGLESGHDQIAIFKAIPMKVQKKMLKHIVKNVNSYRKKIFKLSRLYEEGNLSALYKSSKKSLGELRKQLLYDRNFHMADRVLELTMGAPAFISVGAAHLSGKHGVLRLLKKSGFKIKAIL